MPDLVDARFMSVPERVRVAAALYPERVALQDDDGAMSYGELVALFRRAASGFEGLGIGSGEVVAICSPNSVRYAALYVAAVNLGLVMAPLPQSATDESLARMIADCRPRLILADLENAPRLRGCQSSTPVEDLEAFADDQPEKARDWPMIAPDHVFNIIYSSGTTGRPKGIVQSHAMREAHVKLGERCGYATACITLLSTPLYSNTTLISLFPTLALGGTAILMRKFDAEGFLKRAQANRASHAMLVPIQYQRLLANEHFESFDLSRLREKFCTSAPFTPELKREVLDRWPGNLTEYYGMTEGGGLCILAAHLHPDKLHTVGQPAPDNDIRIIGEAGNEVRPGEAGEIVGRSPNIMLGYHDRPGETAEALWQSPQGFRYMRTGDIGRFDDDGFLILKDRKKDVIISGGFNIYPSDLEEVLRTHPAVADVAVVGVPSERWGETPIGFVVGSTPSDPAELLAYVNERVGKSQRLADLVFVENLPRSQIGKVLKRELRERYHQPAGNAVGSGQ